MGDMKASVGAEPSNIDSILAERGSRYGKFSGHANVTQAMKRAMKAGGNWDNLTSDMQEALEMVVHKIGRITNEGADPDYIDTWDDIAGYAKLVADRLRGDAK